MFNLYIEQASGVIFLGVVLDEHLTWKPHNSHVARKISKAVGILYKASFIVFKLHYALCIILESIHTFQFYCIAVWGSTYQTNLKRLSLVLLPRNML